MEILRVKGVVVMIDKKILKLREKLNNSIKDGESYDVIYKLSVDLDEAIVEYYNIINVRPRSNAL